MRGIDRFRHRFVSVCVCTLYICVLAVWGVANKGGAGTGALVYFLQFYGTCDSSFACLIYFMAITATQRFVSGLGLLFI